MEKRLCSVDYCNKPHEARGYCKGHYVQLRKGQEIRPLRPVALRGYGGKNSVTLEEFFWSRINKTDTCWLWTGSRMSSGHPRLSFSGVSMYAHRYSWERVNGPIPEGASIDHLCHVPECVNPDHLRAATHKQNMENRASAHKNSKSGVRGVHWDKQNRKWRVTIRHENRTRHGGYFDSLEDAEKAAKAQRAKLFTISN